MASFSALNTAMMWSSFCASPSSSASNIRISEIMEPASLKLSSHLSLTRHAMLSRVFFRSSSSVPKFRWNSLGPAWKATPKPPSLWWTGHKGIVRKWLDRCPIPTPVRRWWTSTGRNPQTMQGKHATFSRWFLSALFIPFPHYFPYGLSGCFSLRLYVSIRKGRCLSPFL